jgi:integrase
VLPVPRSTVDATLPYLPTVVADMVRFQLATGCRPGELCIMRPCDVDRSGAAWVYRPETHKTQHHGRERVILIGPKAQDVLRPYLLRAAADYCFTPADSEQKRLAELHARRRTPLSCGNRPGSNRLKHRPRALGGRYKPLSFARAVIRACDAADKAAHRADPTVFKQDRIIERWTPNRLRHTAATEIRKRFGLEAAQVILGHSRADVTQIYAERDHSLGLQVVSQIG